MATNKYFTDASLTLFVDKIKEYTDKVAKTKADLEHKHIASDITDLQTTLDLLVPTSRTINGMELTGDIVLTASYVGADEIGSAESALANSKSYTDDLIATKADMKHTHDDMYYTEGEIDTKVSEINSSITSIVDGTTMVGKANHALEADSATTAGSAEKATTDSSGNVFEEIYETKANAASILSESKSYSDGIKNDLLNGAGEAYDTLKELGELIDDNTDAIDALEIVATGKADKIHSHVIGDVENLQNSLDSKSNVFHEHSISDITNLQISLDNKASKDIATIFSDGLMSSVDKEKLDGIESGAKKVFIQNDEPLNVLDGSMWIDLDDNEEDILINADTLDGKHASDFASVTDVNSLKSLVGDTSVFNQISDAMSNTATKDEIDELSSKYAPIYGYGTTDLTAGSSPLATGKLYFVYE